MDDSFAPVCSTWLAKVKLGWNHKKLQFQNDANEAMKFFDGPYDWIYGLEGARTTRAFQFTGDGEDFTPPKVRMTFNKSAELVQLFGPALYHRNPVRKVNPRRFPELPLELLGDPNDPNTAALLQQLAMEQQRDRVVDQTRAVLLETYLNYTPQALDLKTESR